MRKTRLFSIFLVLFTFLFVSCSDIFESRDNALTITLPGNGRAIAYDSVVASYDVFLCNPSVEEADEENSYMYKLDVAAGSPVRFNNVAEGSYKVHMFAKDVTGDNIDYAKSKRFNFPETTTVQVTFTREAAPVSEYKEIVISEKDRTDKSTVSKDDFTATGIKQDDTQETLTINSCTCDTRGKVGYLPVTLKGSNFEKTINCLITQQIDNGSIASSPTTATTTAGAETTLSVSGIPAPAAYTLYNEDLTTVTGAPYTTAIQWSQADSSGTYTNIDGANSSEYTFTAPETAGTYKYKCTVVYTITAVWKGAVSLKNAATQQLEVTLTVNESEPAPSSAIYVAPNGNDAEGSGSESNPYKTLKYAISKATTETTIYVIGSVDFASADNSGSCTLGANVTIKPYGSNGIVSLTNSSDCFWLNGNKLTISGNGDYTLQIQSQVDLTSIVFYCYTSGAELNLYDGAVLSSIETSNMLINVSSNTSLNIEGGTISECTASVIISNAGTANITRGKLTKNTASDTSDGGIILNNYEMTLGNTESESTGNELEITYNTPVVSTVYAKNDTTINSNVMINNNTATSGSGGIYMYGINITISGNNTTIANNYCPDAGTVSNYKKYQSGYGTITVNGNTWDGESTESISTN